MDVKLKVDLGVGNSTSPEEDNTASVTLAYRTAPVTRTLTLHCVLWRRTKVRVQGSGPLTQRLRREVRAAERGLGCVGDAKPRRCGLMSRRERGGRRPKARDARSRCALDPRRRPPS